MIIRRKARKKNPSPRGDVPADLFKKHAPAIDLALKLMAISGKSGEEANVAAFVIQHLVRAGAPERSIRVDRAHTRTPIRGNTGNVILTLRQPQSGAGRLLVAHLDTVPLCVGSKPVRRGNMVESASRSTGLGADDRAGVAVLLHTACRLLRENRRRINVTFLWTIQEEIGLEGARHLVSSHLARPHWCFNWDGGPAERIAIGATGAYRMKIDVHGVASHAGGHPDEGVSAISIAALAIADLQKNGWHGLIQKDHRRGTSNIGVIQGGDATNVVTDHVHLRAEARSHDPAFRARIVREFQRAFERAARSVKSSTGQCGRVQCHVELDYESYVLDRDDPSLRAAQRAIQELGLTPELIVSNGGLDTNWLYQHGIPGVTLGCGQMNIHTVNEQLDLAAFVCACEIAWKLASEELEL